MGYRKQWAQFPTQPGLRRLGPRRAIGRMGPGHGIKTFGQTVSRRLCFLPSDHPARVLAAKLHPDMERLRVARMLKMMGGSGTYGRWAKKPTLARVRFLEGEFDEA